MFFSVNTRRFGLKKLSVVQILALGFAALILIGTLILMLPISSSQGVVTPFLDCLFTATSAVCVTGLVVVDTGTYWSLFGQIVIISLIQIGGLGFMTFATFLAVLLGKRITLKERLIMQEAYNAFNIQGMVKLMFYVVGIAFSIEVIGAMLLMTQFIPEFGVKRGIYYGLFHAISSFCNAGFDLFGEYRSFTPFAENTVVILTAGALIVLGGLGFAVIAELIRDRSLRHISLHSKVVLSATAALIAIGAILFFIFEYSNSGTMGPMTLKGKILSSILASITPRTAGVNSISLPDMTVAGQFLTILLMFIGASPGSTGGGIKTTTAILIFLTVVAVVRGREDTEMYGKRINKSLVYRAMAISVISFLLVILVTMILSITQEGTFVQFLYEATSAFATVGLSLSLTPTLTPVGKIAVLLTMYAGRVGPLTLALAFAHKSGTSGSGIKYPEDKILVG